MREEIQIPKNQLQPPKIVWILFLLLIFSLSVGTPLIYFQNLRFPLTDLIFPIVCIAFLLSLILKKIDFRWHKCYLLILFYFVSMLVSSVFSINPKQSFIKLAGGIYLLGLAILTFNLIRTETQLKQAIWAWLAGTFIAVLVGVLTIFLFYIQPENSFLAFTTSIYGAVPVGNYPRLTSIFVSSSMFCNYLTVSLLMLFAAEKLQYIGRNSLAVLLFFILVCAGFTISSGLGGIALAIGIWLWLCFKDSHKNFAKLSLIGSISIAVLFFAVNFFALQKYPNAPFIFKIPLIENEVLPSSRLLVWIDSLQTFSANLLTGKGLGQNACDVAFQNTDGHLSYLTDAHNIFLSVAAQNGVFGLLAIAAIIFYFVRKISYSTFNKSSAEVLKNAFVTAFICAFFYQGLTGSFEDTRHLWVLIGFIISAETTENI